MARLPTLRCTKTAPGGLLRVFFQHVVSVRAPPLFSSHFFHFFRGKKTLSNSSHSQVHDLVGRHARVAAADPEVARGLARGHLGEEGRVLAGAVAGPAAERGTEFFFGFFEVEVVSRLFDLAFFFFRSNFNIAFNWLKCAAFLGSIPTHRLFSSSSSMLPVHLLEGEAEAGRVVAAA